VGTWSRELALGLKTGFETGRWFGLGLEVYVLGLDLVLSINQSNLVFVKCRLNKVLGGTSYE